MTIRELVSERIQYPIDSTSRYKDKWLEAILFEETRDDGFFITIESSLQNNRLLSRLLGKYHISGVHKLGNIFVNINVPFYLVEYSEAPKSRVKMSLFTADPRKDRGFDKDYSGFEKPEKYTKLWGDYIEALEKWIRGGKKPKDDREGRFEFYETASDQIENNIYLPDYYTKENRKYRELLKNKNTRELSEVAEILQPHRIPNEKKKGKVLRSKDLHYPFDEQKVSTDVPTTISLRKGDILFQPLGQKTKAYLFTIDSSKEYYASESLVVIRCKDILPEYLYLYLNSETAVKVLNSRATGISYKRITKNALQELPVEVPEKGDDVYREEFRILTNFDTRIYESVERVKELYDYRKQFEKTGVDTQEVKSVRDILDMELAGTIKAYREEQLRSFLSEDLKELNACFRAKAFKATMIMAGSILEAVLIDWLSEIKGEDFFQEPYRVCDEYGNFHNGNLKDYIDGIEQLKSPDWMDESKKAHRIRESRNLVHAKLCMKDSVQIDEKSCRDVIRYLEDVLKSRGQ